jgi:Translocation protein Sec62
MSLLALRVSKIDPHEGHNHAPAPKAKRVKGLWTVKIEQQQECREELHYVWLYEGSQIKMKLYAAGALAIIFAIVLFPLWPIKMRLGVWYLSMGMLGLIGLFFAMSIFRLILFAVTMFVVPPGLWLYPNLFEDVGFFDSFRLAPSSLCFAFLIADWLVPAGLCGDGRRRRKNPRRNRNLRLLLMREWRQCKSLASLPQRVRPRTLPCHNCLPQCQSRGTLRQELRRFLMTNS